MNVNENVTEYVNALRLAWDDLRTSSAGHSQHSPSKRDTQAKRKWSCSGSTAALRLCLLARGRGGSLTCCVHGPGPLKRHRGHARHNRHHCGSRRLGILRASMARTEPERYQERDESFSATGCTLRASAPSQRSADPQRAAPVHARHLRSRPVQPHQQSNLTASFLPSQHPLRNLYQSLSADDGMIRHCRWQPSNLHPGRFRVRVMVRVRVRVKVRVVFRVGVRVRVRVRVGMRVRQRSGDGSRSLTAGRTVRLAPRHDITKTGDSNLKHSQHQARAGALQP